MSRNVNKIKELRSCQTKTKTLKTKKMKIKTRRTINFQTKKTIIKTSNG